MNNCVTRHYRCPDRYICFATKESLPVGSGFFQFGSGATCYGTYRGGQPAQLPGGALPDAIDNVVVEGGAAYLPFDPSEIIDNLHREVYVGDWRHGSSSIAAKLYYLLRPALGVGIRRHLQRFHLKDWERLSFPRWPVDCSVDNLLEQLMLLSLRASRVERIPFIWFWPDGRSSCAIMTHDVETRAGRDFCPTLMDIDDSFGVKSSFQIIPEERYDVSPEFLQSIRQRGFEVVVHDLNHDGHLYRDKAQFLERAAKINSYGKQYRADGFRAGVLYRKQIWYDALKFSYDMSVPNVARLDPQRGGCCTVMPYFLGNILELPVTTIQDYTLFNILNDYSIEIWKSQIKLIMEKHGFMSFIVHPDYIMEPREVAVYRELLGHLAQLRERKNVWITTPGEVNRWWRQRAELQLVEDAHGWHIEGLGKEKASVAYASEKEGRLAITVEGSADDKPVCVPGTLTEVRPRN
ncbi:MAG: hypothetical protein WBW85_16365 [Terriglobales bacterium]